MRCRRYCCYCRSYNESRDIDIYKLEELKLQNPELILLDVRSEQEYAEGHMRGSICIPNYEITCKARKLLPNKKAVIVAYCEYGGRSKKAVNLLRQMGYENVYNLNFS